MNYNDFLAKTGIDKAVKFTRDDIGKNNDLASALKTLFDEAKLNLGRNEKYADEDGYADLDRFFAGYEGAIEDRVDLDEILNDIWVYGFGHCACGNPEEMCIFLRDAMVKLLPEPGTRTLPFEDKGFYYALYELDRVQFTEHGGSVGGSWVDPLGWAFIVLVNAYEKGKQK